MQKTAQSWFVGGPSISISDEKPPSLLADWNSYAASKATASDDDGSSSSIGFDIEAAVRTATTRFPELSALTGTLKGYDQLLNLVLDEALEFLRALRTRSGLFISEVSASNPGLQGSRGLLFR